MTGSDQARRGRGCSRPTAWERQADSQLMWSRYNEMMRRGRTTITSTNLPANDPGGAGAMAAAMKLSLGANISAPQAGGGGQAQ